MSVYKRPDQQTFSYDFQVGGRRFSGNTEATNRKDSEAVERVLKVKARADIEAEKRTGNGPLLLRHAAGRYWEEIGQYHRDYKGTWHARELLIKHFGLNRRLDEIDDADVSGLTAWHRQHTVKGRGKRPVSNATVNRSVVASCSSAPRRSGATASRAVADDVVNGVRSLAPSPAVLRRARRSRAGRLPPPA